MTYEWDPNKAKSNYKNHGVRFADAVGVFEDENAITIPDEYEREDRFINNWQRFSESDISCGVYISRYCHSNYFCKKSHNS